MTKLQRGDNFVTKHKPKEILEVRSIADVCTASSGVKDGDVLDTNMCWHKAEDCALFDPTGPVILADGVMDDEYPAPTPKQIAAVKRYHETVTPDTVARLQRKETIGELAFTALADFLHGTKRIIVDVAPKPNGQRGWMFEIYTR